MRHKSPTLLAAAALLALAACQQSTPAEEEAARPAESEAIIPSPAASQSPVQSAGTDTPLPAAVQGRWGLVPADCEPGRADAKGLLLIGPRTLEFYESVAQLQQIEQSAADFVRASFAFTGEGMSWRRDMSLELGPDGPQTLIRREFGEDAAPEPLKYTRC